MYAFGFSGFARSDIKVNPTQILRLPNLDGGFLLAIWMTACCVGSNGCPISREREQGGDTQTGCSS